MNRAAVFLCNISKTSSLPNRWRDNDVITVLTFWGLFVCLFHLAVQASYREQPAEAPREIKVDRRVDLHNTYMHTYMKTDASSTRSTWNRIWRGGFGASLARLDMCMMWGSTSQLMSQSWAMSHESTEEVLSVCLSACCMYSRCESGCAYYGGP